MDSTSSVARHKTERLSAIATRDALALPPVATLLLPDTEPLEDMPEHIVRRTFSG